MNELSPREHVIKVHESGYAMQAELYDDGSLCEWNVRRPEERWSGAWTRRAGLLRIDVDDYHLVTRAHSAHSIETNPSGNTSPALVLALSQTEEWDPRHPATILKFAGNGSIYACMLLPNGEVDEYNLLDGYAAGHWPGRWSELSHGTLRIEVGDYVWVPSRTDTVWAGEERSSAWGVQELRGVRVEGAADDMKLGLRLPPAIFRSHGYAFHATEKNLAGHFSRVLEVRRPSGNHEQSFAAKIVNKGMTILRNRELDYLELLSAHDGLIAAVDAFDLPDSDDFGLFRGGHVIVLEWGDTDGKRYLSERATLSFQDLVILIGDVAKALSAMHDKFNTVHADVKLENVVGRRTGTVFTWKLTDFNVTSDIDLRTGQAPFLGTTPICISPELAERMSQRHPYLLPADDMWALGIVALQGATGRILNPGTTLSIETTSSILRELPADEAEFVRTMLAPATRRATAIEVHSLALSLARRTDISRDGLSPGHVDSSEAGTIEEVAGDDRHIH